MFKKLLIVCLVSFSTTSCGKQTFDQVNVQNKSDYYYLSSDHIIIAPKLYDNTQYIEYTLDNSQTHISTIMPFVLELEADSLSIGYHSVQVRQFLLASPLVTISTTTTIDFTIL